MPRTNFKRKPKRGKEKTPRATRASFATDLRLIRDMGTRRERLM